MKRKLILEFLYNLHFFIISLGNIFPKSANLFLKDFVLVNSWLQMAWDLIIFDLVFFREWEASNFFLQGFIFLNLSL